MIRPIRWADKRFIRERAFVYRHCIFCSADLKSNDSIEGFPVGRSLAFDGEKGRLWAVCPKCARWNLAPLEERWEAIEDAERLFCDTRTRVQRENIGLAKLRDGTRLVRVGAALPGELAAWRYGESLVRRRRRYLVTGGLASVATMAVVVGAPAAAAALLGGGAYWGASMLVSAVTNGIRGSRLVYTATLPGGLRRGPSVHVRRRHLVGARIGYGQNGLELHIPEITRADGEKRFSKWYPEPLVLNGPDARMALGRAMAVVNARGGNRRDLEDALGAITSAGSPGEMLRAAAQKGIHLDGSRRPVTPAVGQTRDPRLSTGSLDEFRWPDTPEPSPTLSLALEMALHEDTERQALQGELAALEEMWRQAEEIASIADRLPDDPGSRGVGAARN